MGTGSFPGVKRPGRGVDHPPHLALRLKKELSYTSTPPLGIRGLLQGALHIYFTFPTKSLQAPHLSPTRARRPDILSVFQWSPGIITKLNMYWKKSERKLSRFNVVQSCHACNILECLRIHRTLSDRPDIFQIQEKGCEIGGRDKKI